MFIYKYLLKSPMLKQSLGGKGGGFKFGVRFGKPNWGQIDYNSESKLESKFK